eukprot:2426013-Heterocapsa_arctica.AAC.1
MNLRAQRPLAESRGGATCMTPASASLQGRSALGLSVSPEVSDPRLVGGAVPTRAIARCQRSLATDWS